MRPATSHSVFIYARPAQATEWARLARLAGAAVGGKAVATHTPTPTPTPTAANDADAVWLQAPHRTSAPVYASAIWGRLGDVCGVCAVQFGRLEAEGWRLEVTAHQSGACVCAPAAETQTCERSSPAANNRHTRAKNANKSFGRAEFYCDASPNKIGHTHTHKQLRELCVRGLGTYYYCVA